MINHSCRLIRGLWKVQICEHGVLKRCINFCKNRQEGKGFGALVLQPIKPNQIPVYPHFQ